MRKFSEVILCEKATQADIFKKIFNLTSSIDIQGRPGVFYDREGGIAVVNESGHIIGLKPPQHYKSELAKGWSLSALPILPKPDEFAFEVQDNAKSKRLLACIEMALVKIGTDEIVIATDNDKEGELLGWEVLRLLGVEDHPNKTRMLYSEINEKAMKEAYDKKVSAESFRSRFQAGLARLFCDWMFGMNITMALTVANQDKIPQGAPINSGRVIFAISYILYLRENEILNFKPQDYYNIPATFSSPEGNYSGRLIIPEQVKDPETGYLINKASALKIAAAVKQIGKGQVIVYEAGKKSSKPPKGYDRTGLTSHLSRKFKMKLDTAGQSMQTLYGERGLLTYPRVDVVELDEKMHANMPAYIEAIKTNLRNAPQLDEKRKALYEKVFSALDLSRKSSIWKKGIADTEAHHAIIPTAEVAPKMSDLSNAEFIVYEEAAKRLLMQFLPDYEYSSTQIKTQVARGIVFNSSGTTPLRLGWKIFDRPEKDENSDDQGGLLPPLKKGQVVSVVKSELEASTTKVPKRYSEAELLEILKKPQRFIKNTELMKRLKKVEIGTSATRESHVTELETKGYYNKKKDGEGKKAVDRIFPTMKLMEVIKIAPPYFLRPEVSAYWEDAFLRIEKEPSYFDTFMQGQYDLLNRFFKELEEGKFRLGKAIGGKSVPCDPPCKGNRFLKMIKSKKKGAKPFKIWSCQVCDTAKFDDDGKPGSLMGAPRSGGSNPINKSGKSAPCPKCKKSKVYLQIIPNKSFKVWRCEDDKCKASFFDSKGKVGDEMKPRK
tara:strand:- start:7652 stop:9979 length:2328 start_codon:yes stop_codon:yes gene_type:complete